MKINLGVDTIYPEREEIDEEPWPNMTLEEAINILQRNERGRQGKERTAYIKAMKAKEKSK